MYITFASGDAAGVLAAQTGRSDGPSHPCTVVQERRKGAARGWAQVFEGSKVSFTGQQRTMSDTASRDLLAGSTRYRKLQDLNEGTFGVVMLALDTQTNEQVPGFDDCPGGTHWTSALEQRPCRSAHDHDACRRWRSSSWSGARGLGGAWCERC